MKQGLWSSSNHHPTNHNLPPPPRPSNVVANITTPTTTPTKLLKRKNHYFQSICRSSNTTMVRSSSTSSRTFAATAPAYTRHVDDLEELTVEDEDDSEYFVDERSECDLRHPSVHGHSKYIVDLTNDDDHHHRYNKHNPTTPTTHPPDLPHTTESVLIQALTELQNELRIKHDEVYVLQQTIQNLSHIIQESDQHVEHLQRHNEQLQFKLQMLTFYDPHDMEGDEENENGPARMGSSSNHSTSGSHSSHHPIPTQNYETTPSSHRHHPHLLLHQWDTYSDDDHHHTETTTPTKSAAASAATRNDTTNIPLAEPRPLRRSVSMPSLISVPSAAAPVSSRSISSKIAPPQPETWNLQSSARRTRHRTPVSVDDDDDDNDEELYSDNDDDTKPTTTTASTSSGESIHRSSTGTGTSNAKSRNPCREEEKKEEDFDIATDDAPSETKTAISTTNAHSTDCGAPVTGTIVVGPSQAHFYNIILERDSYKNKYQKMVHDLHITQKKLYSTQYKLRTCNTLLELSYNNGDSNNTSGKGNNHYQKTRKNAVKGKPPPPSGHHDPTKSNTATIPRRKSGSQIVTLEQKAPSIHPSKKDALPSTPGSTSPPATISKSIRGTGDGHGPLKKQLVRAAAGVPSVVSNEPPPSQYEMDRPKIPTLPWRRNYGIGNNLNTNMMEKDTALTQVSECVSFISDDEMIHKHWNASSDKAADAIATDQYMNALLSCSFEEDGHKNTCTKLSLSAVPSSPTAIDTDNNRLYRTNTNTDPSDDADRGAGGGHRRMTSKDTTTTSRVAESILFDI